jgi:hypothetical protein
MKLLSAFVCAVFVLVGAVSVLAHQETHKGTVISVEKDTVRVNVLNPKTKKTAPQNFIVDKKTKILRDNAVVTFAAAKIKKDEAIAVTVDHDLDEELALVIRLGVTK